MATVATGVIMRIGTSGVADYPDRTQREVHPARRDESITYTITSDDYGVHHKTPTGENWDHYTYKFHYRHLGRTLTVAWHCGTSYGMPKPEDGLRAAFRDAETVAWEAFGTEWMEDLGFDPETDRKRAHSIYKACESMNTRLDAFFGDSESREAWEQATHED